MNQPPSPAPPAPLPSPHFGIYVHIPFCASKCRYCDFVSRPGTPAKIACYVEALCREIAGAAEAGRRADTVYLGGGTPTILAVEQIAAVLAALRSTFCFAEDAEISIEANPGTVHPVKAERLLELGVNRVSLGIQSFDDLLLARLGRRHSAAAAVEAHGILRRAGFGNIGFDLMHSLPGQRPASWQDDLSRAIDLGPEHLSLYALGVEAGTPFAEELRRGRLDLPGEDEELAMHVMDREMTAAAGYDHYEISNFARPGFRCRHNSIYWTLGEYRGFGAAAHSFRHFPVPTRFANTADIAEYCRRVEFGAPPEDSRETPTQAQLAGEALMLGLRLREGVDTAAYARRFGGTPSETFPEASAQGFEQGWLEMTSGLLRLTNEGVLFSNELFRRLF